MLAKVPTSLSAALARTLVRARCLEDSVKLIANGRAGNTVGGSAGKAVGDTTNNVGKTVSNTTSGLSKTVGDTTGAIGKGDLKGVASGATGGVGNTVSGAGTF
jgi:hypothetical protein